MKKMLDSMKLELINQITSSKTDLRDEITNIIKSEVAEVNQKVDQNAKEIADIKHRLEVAENKLYSEVLKSPPPKVTPTKSTPSPKAPETNSDNVVNAIRIAKKRIGLKPITLEDLDRVANKKKVKGEECLHQAVTEFLNEELKTKNG